MNINDYYTRQEVADLMGVSAAYISMWRTRPTRCPDRPQPVEVLGRQLYRRTEVVAYLKARAAGTRKRHKPLPTSTLQALSIND